MAEFIDFEVSVNDQNQQKTKMMKMRLVTVSDLDSLKSFIDDTEVENDTTFYQQFQNVSNSNDDILKEEYDKSMGDIEQIDLSNFFEKSEEEGEIDEFKDTEQRMEKFKETLFSIPIDDDGNYNSFINAILFALRFNEEQKTDCCNLEALKGSIDNNLFIQLNQEKFNITLDYQLMS